MNPPGRAGSVSVTMTSTGWAQLELAGDTASLATDCAFARAVMATSSTTESWAAVEARADRMGMVR